jgi:hypothetical protein
MIPSSQITNSLPRERSWNAVGGDVTLPASESCVYLMMSTKPVLIPGDSVAALVVNINVKTMDGKSKEEQLEEKHARTKFR